MTDNDLEVRVSAIEGATLPQPVCSADYAQHLRDRRAELVASGTEPLDGATDEEKGIIRAVKARTIEQGR